MLIKLLNNEVGVSAKVATPRYNFCHSGLINKEADGNTLHNVSDNCWNHQNLTLNTEIMHFSDNAPSQEIVPSRHRREVLSQRDLDPHEFVVQPAQFVLGYYFDHKARV